MTDKEQTIIRDLAKKLADLAEQPITEEKRKLWYAHNDLQTDQPVIVCTPEGSWHEIIKPEDLQTTDPELREIEWELRARIYRAEVINDDTPAERIWNCKKLITDTGWTFDGKKYKNMLPNPFTRIPTLGGVPAVWKPGFDFESKSEAFEPVIMDEDMEAPDVAQKIRGPQVIYDEENSKRLLELHTHLLGDILDVHWTGKDSAIISWMRTYTSLRGYQNMLETDLYDYPDEMHSILKVMKEGFINYYRQLEEMGLLDLNNASHYCGTGGYGYTHDLPELKEGEKVTLKHMWASSESQEFVCVSPKMTKEFATDYEKEFLSLFGLSCYGCCETLENKLDAVFEIPNIRRISVSPWANVAKMRERIGMKAVFSVKPNPAYITDGWNEDQQREYITRLLEEGKGTAFEIIMKDTNTIQNDPYRFRQWTDLCRECISKVHG